MWKNVSSILLLAMMLSCSYNSDPVILFEGDPGIHNLPTNVEFQQIISSAPMAKFSTLKYENHIRDELSGKTNLTYTSLVHLEEQDKQVSVNKTEYFFIQPNGKTIKQVTDVDVGVPGILSLVHLTTKHQASQKIQFRKVAQRLSNVSGKLFPLEKGNRLSLNIASSYQMTEGRTHSKAQELNWSYSFQILEHYDGYTLPNEAIQGKIYVIDKRELDPESNKDKTLIHFSETLGAPIKTIRQEDNVVEETRLVYMQK